MSFYFAALIIAISCSAITIKTLIGYNPIQKKYKFFIAIFLLLSWFAPVVIGTVKTYNPLSINVYNHIADYGYYMFGFAFILFVLLILRDVVWYAAFTFAQVIRKARWSFDPNNTALLGKANFIVVVLAVVISLFSIYSTNKIPDIKNVIYQSAKIDKPFKLALIADLHVTSRSDRKSVV